MHQSSSDYKTKHAYDYMNSKIRNALLIIMNDRSFVLSVNSVRVHVYCSREYDVINKFCSYKVAAYHICNRITITFMISHSTI